MPENYNLDLEKEKGRNLNFEDESGQPDEYEELETKLGRRAKKLHKTKYGPRGATKAAQFKRMQESRFYVRSKRKPKIKIVDKTKR